jgi:hypothetical protein
MSKTIHEGEKDRLTVMWTSALHSLGRMRSRSVHGF